jgi:hypothetical protein
MKNRTVRDEVDNTLTKTTREHVEDSPSNTFVTVTTQPVAVDASVDVKEQNERIIAQARGLRASLRDFISAEKKTLE